VTPKRCATCARTDPVMGALSGAPAPHDQDPEALVAVQSLVRAVVYQQLHGRAAPPSSALVALFGAPPFGHPSGAGNEYPA